MENQKPQGQGQSLICWENEGSLKSLNVVCRTHHGKSSICEDISLWTTNVSLMMALVSRSRNHQRQKDSSSSSLNAWTKCHHNPSKGAGATYSKLAAFRREENINVAKIAQKSSHTLQLSLEEYDAPQHFINHIYLWKKSKNMWHLSCILKQYLFTDNNFTDYMSWEFTWLCAGIAVCECALVNSVVQPLFYHSPVMWQCFKLSMCSLD